MQKECGRRACEGSWNPANTAGQSLCEVSVLQSTDGPLWAHWSVRGQRKEQQVILCVCSPYTLQMILKKHLLWVLPFIVTYWSQDICRRVSQYLRLSVSLRCSCGVRLYLHRLPLLWTCLSLHRFPASPVHPYIFLFIHHCVHPYK